MMKPREPAALKAPSTVPRISSGAASVVSTIEGTNITADATPIAIGEIEESADQISGLVRDHGHTLEKVRNPTFPITACSYGFQPVVIRLAMPLKKETEVK